MTLEARIVAAHRSGNDAELERLRDEYRRTRSIVRGCAEAVRFVDESPPRRRVGIRGGGPVEAVFTPRAREQIKHHAFWETGQDGLETGGGLFGINAGDKILVMYVNGPGQLARRDPDRLACEPSAFTHWNIGDASFGRVGDWHTHPETSNGSPSHDDGQGGDLRVWRTGLKWMQKHPHYLGLILTGERGWVRPTFHAWVLDRSDNLERAAMTEGS